MSKKITFNPKPQPTVAPEFDVTLEKSGDRIDLVVDGYYIAGIDQHDGKLYLYSDVDGLYLGLDCDDDGFIVIAKDS